MTSAISLLGTPHDENSSHRRRPAARPENAGLYPDGPRRARPSFAPGVSHREPGGLSTRQVINLFHSIKQPILAADIVEYNPSQDLSNITALVAAKLTKEIAGMMLKTAHAAH